MQHLPAIDDYPARLAFRFCPLCATPLVRRMGAEGERLACPIDGWTHYPMPYLAATVVVELGGGLILLRRAIAPDAGIWHLPIGHIEFGESPAAPALREAGEETGLQLDVPVFLDFEYTPAIGDPAMYYLIFCYRANAVGGELRVDAENSEARVFPPDALPELKWSSQRRAVAAWKAWKERRPWIVGQSM